METIKFRWVLPNGIYQFFDYWCKWSLDFKVKDGKLVPHNSIAELPRYAHVPQQFHHLINNPNAKRL